MNDHSDRELVLLVRNENLNALGELYKRYKKMVFRTAFAITSDEDAANDLLQDVFLRFYRYADRMDVERPIEPWLYRMTANLSYTWIRRRKKMMHPITCISEWLANLASCNPSEIVEQRDNWMRIQKALMRLPVRQRIVIVLYYLNELSIYEIADILEIPAGTVKSRLFNGRKALKSTIELDDIEQAKGFSELEYKGT